MSWVRRQKPRHACKMPRGRHTCGDIWACDQCGDHWKYYDNWAGDGWTRIARIPGGVA